MATLETPSAKSHERVTGRWMREIHAESKRDWAVYYAKAAFGGPVPALLLIFLATVFISRAAVDVSALVFAVLVAGYVVADRFARDKEFVFFTLGADLWLMAFFLVALIGSAVNSDALGWLESMGALRWVPLAYLFAFGWRLFPGLNRVFFALCAFAGAVSAYAVAQHFVGFDLLRGGTLEFAPLKGHAYFTVAGFFPHPEVLGTVLATLLPLPVAAFMHADGREKPSIGWVALGTALLFSLAILWTYLPGLWWTALAGVAITFILQSRRRLLAVVIFSGALGAALFAAYGEPETLTSQVAAAAESRETRQRIQINAEKRVWAEHPWIGAGMEGEKAPADGSLDGNVYFHLLARTGGVGLGLYLLFALAFLQSVYRTWSEIPKANHWHRVLASGGIGGLVAFHASGLYWSTLTDSHAINLYAFLLGSLGYLRDQYENALVPDDHSL